MSDDRKKDKDKRVPPRTGPVRPADSELVAFLERLWTRDNPPESLKVHRVLGTSRNVRDPNPIFRESFAADANYDIERCTLLANEIIAAAQNDTNSNERKCLYEILIADHFQGSHPLQRRLGPLVPDAAQLGGGEGRGGGLGGVEDDDDTGIPGLRPLTHVYLKELAGTVTHTMQQLHSALGDTVQLQQAIIVNQQAHNEKLQNQTMQLHAQLQETADRHLDRELVRKKAEATLGFIKSGLNVGQNLLVSLFGADAAAAPARQLSDGGGDSEGGEPRPRYGFSKERHLVTSFLGECEDVTTPDGRKLAVVFFGDWGPDLTLTDVLAGNGLGAPGIFSPSQFGVFLGVAEGALPPAALDKIMFGADGPQAITPEQMMRAQPLITESMLFTLQQLKQLRDEAAEKAAAQKAQAPAQGGAK